ncbi:MAG: peptidase M16, partial [Atopobiaceae bacterium]|nr:peptidase M16 [Atopobiaceae bacterium]
LYTYFGLDCVGYDELPYVTVLCNVLGKLGTARHSASELDVAIEGGLGGLSFYTENHPDADDPDTVNAYLVNGCSALSEKTVRAAELPQEIWSSTDFTDTDRILELLTQQRIALEQMFLNSGHSAAMSRASSYFSRAALMDQKLSGLDYYRFLKELLAHYDERKEELSAKLAELAERIFSAGNAQMSFTGSEEDFRTWREAAGDLSLAGGEPSKRLVIPEPRILDEGIITPGNVCYVAEVFSTRDLGNEYSGKWQVASKVLSLDYLWNEIRVKGGAYGCGMGATASGLVRYYSYRDPAVDPTVSRFEASAEWLRDWTPTQEEFEGYVISTVSGYDAPVKPRAKARRQDTLRLSGRPTGWRQKLRSQALACTVDDVRGYAELLSHMGGSAGICAFGSRELLEASTHGLELIELMG